MMHAPLPHTQADSAVITHCIIRDWETRSTLDLCKSGAVKYAADPMTEVIGGAFAVDDGPVQLWRPGDPVPPEFFEAEKNPAWAAVAHNDWAKAPLR